MRLIILYLLLAFLISCYQAYRGFMFQRLPIRDGWLANLSNFQKIILLCLADAILYFVSTASGFLALFYGYRLATQIDDFSSVELGTSVLLVFLAIYGILGVTGQLPHLMAQGKLLPKA